MCSGAMLTTSVQLLEVQNGPFSVKRAFVCFKHSSSTLVKVGV